MSRRLTILAGAGALVPEVISGARAAGDDIQILPLVDRTDLGLAETFGVADLPRLIWKITAFRSTHVTLVGGLRASTADREAFKRATGAKGGSGDAALLKLAEKVLALTGARLVGAEAIVPGILAEEGLLAGPEPGPGLVPVARMALEAARRAGTLDLGQAVVATSGRILAVEDFAGTDALLQRIARYRAEGLEAGGGLVLAKSLKPQQSQLIDRPAIGPDTVRNAAAAGIAVIAVEAGGAILIDREGIAAAAQTTGTSVLGIALDAA